MKATPEGAEVLEPGGLCEGMFFGRDHEKEQIIDANLCKTGTD